jgi:hypothetical protein
MLKSLELVGLRAAIPVAGITLPAALFVAAIMLLMLASQLVAVVGMGQVVLLALSFFGALGISRAVLPLVASILLLRHWYLLPVEPTQVKRRPLRTVAQFNIISPQHRGAVRSQDLRNQIRPRAFSPDCFDRRPKCALKY